MYWLLILSVFVASFNSVFLNRARVTRKDGIIKFNLICSVIWFVILFTLNGFRLNLTPEVMLFGVIYGLTQALFILFKTLAMSTGSVSITTLIGNSSMLISLLVSFLAWGEPIGLFDIFGLMLLACAIFLTTYKGKESAKPQKMWKYFALLFLVFAAGVGITFKAFGKYCDSAFCSDMLLVSSVVMSLCYGGAFVINSLFCKDKTEQTPTDRSFWMYAVLGGILSCTYNRLNIFLAGVLDAVIFFPGFNGGVILVSALLGMIICKERLTTKQKLGIILGAIAICIIGIF